MHNETLVPYLLLLGDSALVQGQRLCGGGFVLSARLPVRGDG